MTVGPHERRSAAVPMSSQNPADVLDLLTEFPHAVGAFAEMRRYVKSVAQFSDFPSAQSITRLKAELRRTADPVREGEIEYEIEVAELDARCTVPRIVWGSILVAIYATFETGVRNALAHWANNVPGAAPFEVKGVGRFQSAANDYASMEAGVELFSNVTLKESVLELKSLRDSFAHSVGCIPHRRTELHSTIDKARERGYEISVENENWIATPRIAAYYLLQAERAYKIFADALMEEYIARMAPPAEA